MRNLKPPASATNKNPLLPIDRLETLARDDGQTVSVLLNLLWLVSSHFRLRGAIQVWRHLSEILLLVPVAMQTSLNDLGIQTWVPLLEWLLRDPARLSQRIFPGEDAKANREQALFLQSAPPNPTLREGRRGSGLYSVLWCSLSVLRLEKQFRILQAHMLVAHIHIMRALFSYDNWKQRNPPDPKFYAWLYLPALQLRHFSESNGEWNSILRDAALSLMPISCPRKEFPARLRAVARTISCAENYFKAELLAEAQAIDSARVSKQNETGASHDERSDNGVPGGKAAGNSFHQVSEGLREIANFLDWGLNPIPRDNRTGHGRGGNRKGGSKSIGGAGDTYGVPVHEETDDTGQPEPETGHEPESGEEDELDQEPGSEEVLVGDEDDPDDPPVVLHVMLRADEKPELRAALIAAGDHPDELLSGQAVIFASDRAGVSFANSGAAERAHQLLSDSYHDLSLIELAVFFLELQSASQQDPAVLELYALVSVCVWTGASLQQAMNLAVVCSEIPEQECELTLRVDGPRAWWRVRSLPLAIQAQPAVAVAQEPEKYFELPDVVGGSRAVRSYFEHLRSIANASAGIQAKCLRIFSRDVAWYKQRLRDFVKNENGRVTWAKLSRVLFQQIIDHTGGDKIYAAIITKNDHHLAEVGRHYATPPVRELQRLYVCCSRELRDGLFWGGYELDPLPLGELAPPALVVGSPLCSTNDSFRDMARVLKDIVTSGTGWSFTRHNALVCYVVEMFAVCVAMRGIYSPLQVLEQVDLMSCYTFVADKGLEKGRLVHLPTTAVTQMALFECYLKLLPKYLPNAPLDLPCFFVTEEGKVEVVGPATILKHLGDWLPAANAARHLVYTYLQRHASPDVRDAMFGHFWYGESPFGHWSSFRYAWLEDEVRPLIESLLDELGFEPIEITL